LHGFLGKKLHLIYYFDVHIKYFFQCNLSFSDSCDPSLVENMFYTNLDSSLIFFCFFLDFCSVLCMLGAYECFLVVAVGVTIVKQDAIRNLSRNSRCAPTSCPGQYTLYPGFRNWLSLTT